VSTSSSELVTEVGILARRSVRRTLRQPALVVPTVVFPLFLLAVNASGLADATKIPGFPADSYLDFAISVPFMQGALFASTTAGTELANDIETGFLNRLQLTPLRGAALLAGQMAGALLLAVLGSIVYLIVGLIAGVTIKAGVGGVLVLLALALLIAIGFAGIGAILATQTGSSQAVQGMFPLVFVLFFLSSMSMPRPLIQVDWFRTVATWNPISYLVEGLRSLVITGWDGAALWRGFAVAIGLMIVTLTLASRGLRTRMERT
jgi:ABC-2 type transport system permease protein